MMSILHICALMSVSCLIMIGCEPEASSQTGSSGGDQPPSEAGSEAGSSAGQQVDAGSDARDLGGADAQVAGEGGPALADMEAPPTGDAETRPEDDMTLDEPRENLLIDPSFEEGSSAWGVWGGAMRVDGDAHEGGWALRATNGNGAEQRITGLTPNATYRLSGWGKTLSEEPMLIGIKDYGGEQLTLVFTNDEYQADSLSFTMGGRQSEAVVFAYKHRDEQPGFADAISLTLESEPPPPRDPLEGLELIWSDEFDGSGSLDPTKWTFEEGFARNEELQWYQTENAFRDDGLLVIEGRREDRPNPTYVEGSTEWRTRRERIEYSSASVITEGLFSWQYGRLEVRAKVTNFTGTWPAIWTLGVECEWPSSGEVDVMENYQGDLLANFAWGTNRRWNAQWNSSRHPVSQRGEGWVDEFHLWALDWTEDRMTITLDGEVLNTIDLNTVSNGTANCEGQNPFRQPHYLLLNLALGGAGGSVDQLTFPTRYLVDYVRVYQAVRDGD